MDRAQDRDEDFGVGGALEHRRDQQQQETRRFCQRDDTEGLQ